LESGPEGSARSQWPRASHKGLMHCTVKPGKYCMSTSLMAKQLCASVAGSEQSSPRRPEEKLLGGIVGLGACGVKRK
jgi:hypothetical protein